MTRNAHAAKILTARAALAAARDARDELDRKLDADYPAPADDCDMATFDAWNDAYEDARCARGGYDLDTRVRECEATLIQAVREALAPLARATDSEIADVAFAAALGERSPIGFVKARRRVLELCHSLDVTTL